MRAIFSTAPTWLTISSTERSAEFVWETKLYDLAKMIRRMSMIFKNKDRDKTTNSTSSANGAMATINEDAKPAPQPRKNRIASKNPPPADHSASRDGNVATFKMFAQVIHAASQQRATGTGDGSYVEDAKTGSLPADLTSLNVKDFETLNILLKKEPSGSKLADDMTMIMERVIQVCTALRCQIGLLNSFLASIKVSSKLYQQVAYTPINAWRQI